MMVGLSSHPTHHPSEARLLDYVAGSMAEPMALLVATHLALCPRCRREANELEELGGALFEELEPAPFVEDGLARVFARLERQDEEVDDLALPLGAAGEPDLPEPLRSCIGGPLASLSWRRLGPLGQATLLPHYPGMTTRLLSIRAETAMPRHTHEGGELTLVLRGAFHDTTGHYLRGDVAEADSEVDHRPIVDEGADCLCLAVTDAPLKLTGRLGRLVNPFVRL
jgi:putative transcriptional regulator